MELEKRLGKIKSVSFGHGGYQDAQLGLSITFESEKEGWGVGKFYGGWDAEMIDCSEHAKWTETDRDKTYSDTMRFISKILKQAKVNTVDQLKDIPVECTFDFNTLKDWRILEEVL